MFFYLSQLSGWMTDEIAHCTMYRYIHMNPGAEKLSLAERPFFYIDVAHNIHFNNSAVF